MTETHRIAWLDVARGGSILLVVVFHASIQLQTIGLDQDVFWAVNNLLAPVRMPLFFAVSGYLSAPVLAGAWRTVLCRRIWPMAYLFALWTAIHVAFRALVHGTGPGEALVSLATSFLVPTSEIWFILALGLFTAATRAFSALPRPLLTAAAVMVAVATFSGLLPLENSAHRGMLQYYPFFLIGCFHGEALVTRVERLGLPATVLAAAAFVVLFRLSHHADGLPLGLLLLALALLGLAVGCRLAQMLATVAPLARALTHLGRNTLPIYLAHPFLLSGGALGLGAGVLPEAAGYAILPAAVALSIAASLTLRSAVRSLGAGWLYAPPA